MFDKKVVNNIDKCLHKDLNIIFDFEFNGFFFLYGETLKKFIMGDNVLEYSFILLTQEKSNIYQFINKYNLSYEYTINDGYRIIYNDISFNIKITNDLCYVGNLSTDFIFYDVSRKQIIPFGIKRAICQNEIVDYGNQLNDVDNKLHIDESINFIKFLNNKKKARIKKKNLFKENYIFDDNNHINKGILTSDLINKLDNVIKEKFDVIYNYDFNGIVLLYGGTVRSIMLDIPVNDFDFVVLTQDGCQLLQFIKKYKLRYTKNAYGGYKILWHDFEVDICSIDDLYILGVYDTDMLFYDINKHMFITWGFVRAINNRMITEVNSDKEPIYSNKLRLKKIIKFMKYISNNNKYVRVRQNSLLWEMKMFRKRIKLNIKKIKEGNFRKCFRFITSCKKEFYLMVFLGILIAFLAVVFPALSGMIVTGIMNMQYKQIFIIILIMAILKVTTIILQFLFSKLYLVVNRQMVFNIRRELADCVLNFEMDNFSDNNSGAFIDKLKNDPNEITKAFNSIKDILIRGLGNIGVLGYIFYLDYRIGLVFIIFMIIIFRVKMIGVRKRREFRFKYYYNQERYSGILGEMISGVSDIKGLNLKNNYIKKADDSSFMVGDSEYKGDYCQNLYNKIATLIELVAIFVVVLLGLVLVKHNMLDASSLIIIYMYNSTVFAFLERIGLLMSLKADLNVSCNRIFSLLDSNLYTKEVFGNKFKKKCLGKIEFVNVCFKYKNKKSYVLSNCSFKIDSNEMVAIVGKSGVGKSTILNLITRLYDVDNGFIKIDDILVTDYCEAFIRDNVSIISQSPYLFDMSIKDNLRLVREDISDEEIINVCKMVCLSDFIDNLPNKYDTVIGEGGLKLSGGQKQRLGIARALVKNTKIILLDEITSSLDNDTGTIIKKVIDNIKKDHTLIVVTHELSMIKDCSRILVLDDGKIIADGTHSELIKNNDLYKKLYKLK